MVTRNLDGVEAGDLSGDLRNEDRWMR